MPATTQSARDHWDDVYARTAVEETGWFEELPTVSLSLIDRCNLGLGDAVLDVGAGASSLTSALLDRGHRDLTVLDISANALEQLRARFGPDRAAQLRFINADIRDPDTLAALPPVRLWHDRAMLHFLSTDADCASYARAVRSAVVADGYVLLATYALDGAPT